MGNKDKIKLGDKANLPLLIPGGLACVDNDQELWMGTSGGNVHVGGGSANVAAPTFVIAQSGVKNASRADYQCNGTNDHLELIDALASLTASRTHRETIVMRGAFNFADTVTIAENVVLDIRQAKITAQAGVTSHLLKAYNDNITIIGGLLDINTQHAHGIGVEGDNFIVRDTIITDTNTDTTHDGVYIHGGKNGYFGNLIIDGTNRCGIALISGENALIEDCKFLNIAGSSPQCGVDLEPNLATEKLINIHVVNCSAYNCVGHGFTMNVMNLTASSAPVSVFVDNFYSQDTHTGFAFSGHSDVLGNATFTNCTSVRASHNSMVFRNPSVASVRIECKNISLIDGNTAGGSDLRYFSGLTIFNETTDSDIGDIGNIDINGLNIYGAAHYFGIGMRSYNGNIVKNVKLRNVNVEDVAISDRIRLLLYENEDIYIDAIPFTYSVIADHTLKDIYAPMINNTGATGTVRVTLSHDLKYCPPTTFTVTEAQNFQIDPEAPDEIIPYCNGSGKLMSSFKIGDSVTLEKINSTQWRVLNLVDNGFYYEDGGLVLSGGVFY